MTDETGAHPGADIPIDVTPDQEAAFKAAAGQEAALKGAYGKPVEVDHRNVINAEYNEGVAEYGNAAAFCEAKFDKQLLTATQMDGYVYMEVGPLV